MAKNEKEKTNDTEQNTEQTESDTELNSVQKRMLNNKKLQKKVISKKAFERMPTSSRKEIDWNKLIQTMKKWKESNDNVFRTSLTEYYNLLRDGETYVSPKSTIKTAIKNNFCKNTEYNSKQLVRFSKNWNKVNSDDERIIFFLIDNFLDAMKQ